MQPLEKETIANVPNGHALASGELENGIRPVALQPSHIASFSSNHVEDIAESDEDLDQVDGDDGEIYKRRVKTVSSLSRLFIGAAVFHACAVIAFQSAILGLTNFSLVCNGGVGVDRKIYAILFISAMIYVILLVLWALYSENIIEVYAFDVIQLLSIIYSCTQIYQFFEAKKEYSAMPDRSKEVLKNYDPPIILAISTVILGVVMGMFYLYGTYHLYIEFGWKIYTTVPFKSEAKLRGVFSTYQIFTCFLKLELFFTEMFLLSHVTLLLRDNPNDPEFVGSVIAMVLAVVTTVIVYLAVRRENRIIMICFMLVLLALIGYYSYKMFRFITESCPLCQRVQNEVCNMPAVSLGSTGASTAMQGNLTFEHLSLFAAIVDINTALLFLVSLNYMTKFGCGLKKIFRKLEQRSLRFARDTVRAFSGKVHADDSSVGTTRVSYRMAMGDGISGEGRTGAGAGTASATSNAGIVLSRINPAQTRPTSCTSQFLNGGSAPATTHSPLAPVDSHENASPRHHSDGSDDTVKAYL